MTQDFVEETVDLTIANAATVSDEFQIRKDQIFIGLFVPAIDDGDLGIEVSQTSGGTFVPIIDPSDGADLVVLASGNDPGYVDVSDFLRPIPSTFYLRLTCAAQTGAKTVTLTKRG